MNKTLSSGILLAALAGFAHAAAGDVQFTIKTGAPIRGGVLADQQGGVVVGTLAGDVLALDSRQQERWRTRLAGAITTTPVRVGELLLISSSKGITALQASDGKVRWEKTLGNLGLEHLKSWDSYQPDPLVSGEQVVLAFGQQVLLLDARDGKTRWSVKLPSGVMATPLKQGKRLLLSDDRGQLHTVDMETGRQVGSVNIADNMIQQSPALQGKTLFYSSRDGKIRARKLDASAADWEVDHGSSWVIATPLLDAGKIIVGSSDSQLLQGIDQRSGKVVWELPAKQNVFRKAVRAGGLYWFAGGDAYAPQTAGRVQAVSPEGKMVRELTLSAALFGQPVLDRTLIWVGGEDGILYAIRSE